MANPFLSQDFHIRWSALDPKQIEAGIKEALKRADEALNRLVVPAGVIVKIKA